MIPMITSETRTRVAQSNSQVAGSKDLSGRVAERFPVEGMAVVNASEEVLVVDDRSGLSPAQAVEDRLSRMLREATMPISHLQMRGILRTR
jgi:hypothetical protein